jgi:hypothetical protein
MGTVKENPNDLQLQEAKTTRPGSLDKSKAKLDKEMEKKKPQKVAGDKDEAAADQTPFDARSNNMHRKR